MNSPLRISNRTSSIKPKISVIFPVYNGGKYLKLSLQSVLYQKFKDFELLIIDDGSSDESCNYLQSIQDERISLYKNERNKGLFYNINFLIGQSSTYLIKLWAQDDIMYPHCLQSFVSFHEQHPDLGFSYSARDMIDDNGNIKPTNKVDKTPTIISTELHAAIAYYTGSIAGNIANVCINKRALQRVGYFKESMKISGDFDMWVRLAEHHETGFINEKLIQLRDHSGQLSRNKKYYLNHVKEDLEVYRYLNTYVSKDLFNEGKKILRNHKLRFYYTLMLKSLLQGDLKTGWEYIKVLALTDNFFLLSTRYFFLKLKKTAPPNLFLQKESS